MTYFIRYSVDTFSQLRSIMANLDIMQENKRTYLFSYSKMKFWYKWKKSEPFSYKEYDFIFIPWRLK